MSQKLHVIATVQCKPGTEDAMIAAIQDCAVQSRLEEGCEVYRFYKHAAQAGKFVFIETWRDKAALDLHVTLPHFLKMIETVQPLLLADFDIQLLEEVAAA